MVHPQIAEQRLQSLLNVALRQRLALFVVLQLEHGTHIFCHREFAKNRGFLRQIGQAHARAAMNGHARDVLTIDQNLATVGTHQTHDHVERRGFTCAVGAKQSDHFAFLNLQ